MRSLNDYSQEYNVPDSDKQATSSDTLWLLEQIAALTDTHNPITVSEWAEAKRYLPRQVTSMPGMYRYEVVPYLKEPSDCLSITSDVREIDVMKGAQIGATVGLIENAIGYIIEHLRSVPVLMMTADAELAKLRLDANILPMLQHSGLMELIQSVDDTDKRKTGKTAKRLEWAGGGYLLPFGARNADKLRSTSVQYLLQDECDAFPVTIGKDGDPQKLAEARTRSYKGRKKILRISTPLLRNTSRIERGFKKGDQRYYYVPCRKCRKKQRLRFRETDTETGQFWGLIWEMKENRLVSGSVKYLCEFCGHPHRNADKAWMLPRGEWRATVVPDNPWHRSYHVSAMYSPIGMYSWEDMAREWLEAWDDHENKVRDVSLLQTFYNNSLGETFLSLGSRVRYVSASSHRRTEYCYGSIPNIYALKNSGSSVLFLTCQVDVHDSNLAVAVMGWTRNACCYLVDYWRFTVNEGEPDGAQLTSPVWQKVRDLVENKEYVADDGRRYRIALTLIDAGYANDTVVTFCSDYSSGLYPILGRARPAKHQTIKEFAEFKTQAGAVGYRILVDHYKDRMASVLRRDWSEISGMQASYHFNCPVDATQKQLTELTVEVRKEVKDDSGILGYVWKRPGGARNELWDLLGYGYAAVDILAYSVCIQHFGLETIDWAKFWDYLQTERIYSK